MDVFDLVATLTLDSEGFEQGLGQAKNKASSFGGVVKTAAKTGAAAIGAVTVATTAMAGAFVKGVGDIATYGDNIDKMAQKMGMSAQAYQEWDAIMQHSGTTIESMQSSMKTLASAAETGSDAFAALGMSQEEIASMSQEELFSRTITALQNVDDETQRTYLAGKLLGRGATELGALLNTSAEETEAMRQRVHELGGVMSDEAVKNAAAYQDSLQDMQTAFKGLSRNLLTDFMPSLTTVMDGLTEIFTGDSDSGLAMISEGIDQIISQLGEKLPEFLNLGMGIVNSLVEALIQNLPKLLEMGGSLIGQLIVGLITYIPELIRQVPAIVKAIVSGLASAWPDIRQAGINLLQTLINAIKSRLSSLKSLFNFSWELPKIKLPHFTWTWNDLGVIKIPNISIEWYKKAYETPYVFDKPTVMGFGDGNGGEMVYGHANLMSDIKSAIGDVMSTTETPIKIVVQSVLDGKVIGETAYEYSLSKARAYG